MPLAPLAKVRALLDDSRLLGDDGDMTPAEVVLAGAPVALSIE